MKKEELETLAEEQHEIWASWMKYLFTQGSTLQDGSFVIIPEKVKRWKRQMSIPFAELTEEEKETDRRVVREYHSFEGESRKKEDFPLSDFAELFRDLVEGIVDELGGKDGD